MRRETDEIDSDACDEHFDHSFSRPHSVSEPLLARHGFHSLESVRIEETLTDSHVKGYL